MKRFYFIFMLLINPAMTWGQIIGSRLDSTYEYDFTTNNDSTLFYKTFYKYDNYGRNTSRVDDSLNSETHSFFHRYKEVSTYDDNGNKLLFAKFLKRANNLQNYTKQESIFNAKNQEIITFYSFNWDTSINDWKTKMKEEHSYNSDNQEIITIWSGLNTTTNSWQLSERNENGYDKSGQWISALDYFWNTTEKNWILMGKREAVHDTRGNQVLFTSWINVKNTWIGKFKAEYTFDSNNNNTAIIHYN